MVVLTVSFYIQPEFSNFERTRLAKQKNKKAIKEQKHIEAVPLLLALRAVMGVLVGVALVAYSIWSYGLWSGVFASITLLLSALFVRQISLVQRVVDNLRDKILPQLQEMVFRFRTILKLFKERSFIVEDRPLGSQAELLDVLENSSDIMTDSERNRLKAGLKFDKTNITEVMTRRRDIQAVPLGETLGPFVLDELYKTGYSRFPVFEGDIDHVVGILCIHDLLDLKRGSVPARQAMQTEVNFIREDDGLRRALYVLIKSRQHLLVVVNEQRKTVGLLSLGSVVEAFMGERNIDDLDTLKSPDAVALQNPNKARKDNL